MGSLTAAQRQAFDAQGYVLIRGGLDEKAFAPLWQAISSAVDQFAAQRYREGRISELYQEMPLSQRLLRIFDESEQGPIMGWLWNQQVFSRAIYELLAHPKILDIVESLIGQEITANGDYWVRFKPPTGEQSVFPWHQDSIYYNGNIDPAQRSQVTLSEECDILTVWMPLIDCDEHNGCLQVVSGSHKYGLRPPRPDENGRLVPVEDVENFGKIETLQMNVGDILVFGNLTFHRSLENRSDAIRWSIDLRYSPTDSPLEWFHKKWPNFIARSRRQPDSVESWEMWRAKRRDAN